MSQLPRLRPPHVVCDHCRTLTTWPIWVRQDERDYAPMCGACYRELDRTFTAEAALVHALIIIGVHQGKLMTQGAQR